MFDLLWRMRTFNIPIEAWCRRPWNAWLHIAAARSGVCREQINVSELNSQCVMMRGQIATQRLA
ncbi:hypothetical protein PSENEW3n2_00005166 [Picochlorum sp. SENEW3]|nr:hypothetical protein PSENEW3n2_00005166 [Picochlorum sp. SENEW3]WPT17161.1 hypothetical protein PSENEW3_00005166 [Picochlorum sp. SENEW3]